jgi:hypothetical protein
MPQALSDQSTVGNAAEILERTSFAVSISGNRKLSGKFSRIGG